MKHNESDFVLPALKALYSLGGKATMSRIKDEVPNHIALTDDDLEIFKSGCRNEPVYRQTVGNIVSHHSQGFFAYVDKVREGPIYRYVLNSKGTAYIESLLDADEGVDDAEDDTDNHEVHGNSEPTGTEIDKTDKKFIDYVVVKGLDKRPPGDPKIREAVLDICGRQCQYGLLIGENHQRFLGKDGKPYVEAHHLIPMEARDYFFPKSLDRPSNITCLCPVCHSILTHGSKEEKRKILSVLYSHCKEQLNNDGLYIDFDNLMNKYY